METNNDYESKLEWARGLAKITLQDYQNYLLHAAAINADSVNVVKPNSNTTVVSLNHAVHGAC